MANLEIQKVEELSIIEKSRALQIQATFDPMVLMLKEFEASYDEIMSEAELGITDELSIKARELRVSISKVRINTEKIRKREKEEYLRAGKAIDGVANLLKWAVSEKEEKLNDIETFYQKIEEQKKVALQINRMDMLKPFVGDDYFKDLSSMDEDVFKAFLQVKKKDFEDLKAAEKQAELDKIAKEKADKDEQERIKAENEKLKKEADARQKQYEIEKAKREKEEGNRLAKLEADRIERETYEKRKQEEHKLQLEKERVAREKIQKELSDKLEADRKATYEAEQKMQFDLKKDDILKVNDLINDLRHLKGKYSFKSKEVQRKYSDVGLLIDKIINQISK